MNSHTKMPSHGSIGVSKATCFKRYLISNLKELQPPLKVLVLPSKFLVHVGITLSFCAKSVIGMRCSTDRMMAWIFSPPFLFAVHPCMGAGASVQRQSTRGYPRFLRILTGTNSVRGSAWQRPIDQIAFNLFRYFNPVNFTAGGECVLVNHILIPFFGLGLFLRFFSGLFLGG